MEQMAWLGLTPLSSRMLLALDLETIDDVLGARSLIMMHRIQGLS